MVILHVVVCGDVELLVTVLNVNKMDLWWQFLVSKSPGGDRCVEETTLNT